jgi:hypothetical protein
MIIIDIVGPLVSANDFKNQWTINEIMKRWRGAFSYAYRDLVRKGIAITDMRYEEPIEIGFLVPLNCKFDLDNVSSTEKVIIDCLKDFKIKDKTTKKMQLISRGIIPDDNQKHVVAMFKRFDSEAGTLQVIVTANNRFDMEIDTAIRMVVNVPEKPKSLKKVKRLDKIYSRVKR